VVTEVELWLDEVEVVLRPKEYKLQSREDSCREQIETVKWLSLIILELKAVHLKGGMRCYEKTITINSD
jgi:hypothetical protein